MMDDLQVFRYMGNKISARERYAIQIVFFIFFDVYYTAMAGDKNRNLARNSWWNKFTFFAVNCLFVRYLFSFVYLVLWKQLLWKIVLIAFCRIEQFLSFNNKHCWIICVL